MRDPARRVVEPGGSGGTVMGETPSGADGSTDEFETAAAEFAIAYADQNAIDHGSLYAASLDGRIDVQRGV